jgi:hypothetical protein
MSRPYVPKRVEEPKADKPVFQVGPNGQASATFDLMAYLENKRKKRLNDGR